MKNMTSKVVLGAVLAGCLAAVVGCGEPTPWVSLGQARNAFEISLASHEIVQEENGERVLVGTLRLVDTGARLDLPCLTVSLIFQKGSGDSRFDWKKEKYEVDLSGFEGGTTQEFEVRYPMPAGSEDVTGVTAALHQTVQEGGLRTLCEAAAVN